MQDLHHRPFNKNDCVAAEGWCAMLGPYERAEVCRLVQQEFSELQNMVTNHGSYRYLCSVGGVSFLSHTPVGRVLRDICP